MVTLLMDQRTPEELAVEWLMTAIYKAMSDPVENFIGALSSSVPDWADQHDKYVGQALMEQMYNEEEKGRCSDYGQQIVAQ